MVTGYETGRKIQRRPDVTRVTPDSTNTRRVLVLRNADDVHREDHERGEAQQSSDVEKHPTIFLHGTGSLTCSMIAV